MGICNPDGTPYQVSGSLQQFDPGNPDLALFDIWDEEAIEQGGSPIFYYEVFIQPQTIDPIYWEDRGKLWSNDPVQLFCYYEPIASSNNQGLFGIDSPDEMVFELNYHAVLNTIGHPPKIGSRIFTPMLRENWEIIQRNLAVFTMWNTLHIQLICKRFQESTTTGEGKVTQKMPDFTLNQTPILQ